MVVDNRVRLIHEIDASPSMNSAQQLEARWDQTHQRIGKGAQNAARIGAIATRTLSAGIGAVTAAGAASERQWLSLGTTILASFAAGGPIAGGIAIVAGAIGLLVGGLNDTEKAVRRTSESFVDLSGSIKVLDDLAAASDFIEVRDAAIKEAAAMEMLGRELTDVERAYIDASLAGNTFSAELEEAARQANDAVNRVKALRESMDFLKNRAQAGVSESQSRLSSAQSFAAALNRPASLGEDLARRREANALALQETDAIFRNFAAQETLTEAEKERTELLKAQIQALEAERKIYEDLVPLVEKLESPSHRFGEFMQQQADSFRTSLGPAISQTVADGLTDGLDTGFENAGDIARRFFLGLFNQAATLMIMKAVGSIAPSLFVAKGAAFAGGRVLPFARGGVVDRPTLFPMANGMGLIGEAGPEAVLPLRRGRGGKLGVEASGGRGGSISFGDITISRDLFAMSEEEQARAIAPVLIRALRTNQTVRTMVRRGGL